MNRARRVRSLLPILITREIRTRYRTSLLDLTWAVITPLALLGVYGFILANSFNVTAACGSYLSSAWAGLVLWTAFATAVGGAVYSLVASSDLITKVYFPLEAMPLSVAGASLLDLGVGLLSLVVLIVVQGIPMGAWAAGALLPIAVLVVWAAVISVLVAVLATFVRDTIHAVNLALRLGFFATPVMYDASFLPPALAWTASVNPVAAAIAGLRDTMLCATAPDTKLLAVHLAVGLVVFGLAILYVRSVESRIVDVV